MSKLYKHHRTRIFPDVYKQFRFESEFNYYFTSLFMLTMRGACKKDTIKPSPSPVRAMEIAGQSYRTIKVGNQEWMINNYEGVRFNTANSKPESGKYYSWIEVQAISLPQGWRIPTTEDFVELAKAQGIQVVEYRANRQEKIKSLISKTNWSSVSGNNVSEFNAYSAGYVFRDGSPQDADIAEFWTIEGRTFSIQEIATKTPCGWAFTKTATHLSIALCTVCKGSLGSAIINIVQHYSSYNENNNT